MTQRINIIYVRNTVGRLLPYLATLLEHTDWAFRLVANGCGPAEQALLRDLTERHGDRVEVRVESEDQVLDHGVVLDRLLDDEPGEYFCFVDSDVLATGATALADLLPADDEVATCSCVPIWHRPSDSVMPSGFEIAAGRYVQTEGGEFLGVSYAAAYRTHVLREQLRRWNVGMSQCGWGSLPATTQAELERRGFKFRTYDTAKVANLLVQLPGSPMVHRDLPMLVHVGGQSGPFNEESPLRARFRQQFSFRTPWLYGMLWRARGFSKEESRSLAELAGRTGDFLKVIDGISTGRLSIDERPDWLSAENYRAVAQVSAAAQAGPR